MKTNVLPPPPPDASDERRRSRRTFLRGAGGALLAVPFLESVLPRQAWGAGGKPPPRLFIHGMTNGTLMDEWTPTGGETTFKLSEFMSPLEAHRADLVFVAGLDMHTRTFEGANGHDIASSHLLTGIKRTQQNPRGGFAGGPSVDEYVGSKIGATTKFKAVHAGVKQPPALWQFHYSGANSPVPFETKPDQLFAQLFGNFTGTTDPKLVAARRARRASVLDGVKESFTEMWGRAGKDDRARLEHHLDLVRDTERALTMDAPAGGCGKPTLRTPLNHQETIKLFIDMLVAALACDITRVATLDTQHSWGIFTDISAFLPGVKFPAGADFPYHKFIHDGPGSKRDQWRALFKWHNQMFVYLLERMKGVKEEGGTLLSNSLVYFANDFSWGGQHNTNSLPVVLAGQAQGRVRTGRFLNFANAWAKKPTSGNGVTCTGLPHNDLLVSIVRAMGLPDTTFGDPAFCSGGLPGLVA